jgi:hypothetical protein
VSGGSIVKARGRYFDVHFEGASIRWVDYKEGYARQREQAAALEAALEKATPAIDAMLEKTTGKRRRFERQGTLGMNLVILRIQAPDEALLGGVWDAVAAAFHASRA